MREAPYYEEILDLYRYWEALPDGRPRKAIDPIALGSRLIKHVSLGAFIDGCRDVRYDLIGQELKIVAPRLAPGDRSSDALRIQNRSFDLIHHLLITTGQSCKPHVFRVLYASMEGVSRGIYTTFLPLGRQTLTGGETVATDLMIGLWRFEPDVAVDEDCHDDLTDAFMRYQEHLV